MPALVAALALAIAAQGPPPRFEHPGQPRAATPAPTPTVTPTVTRPSETAVRPVAGCVSPTLCGVEALGGIASRFEAARSGATQLHILQIGDSHTAGDMITSAVRGRLQARYGIGGRGVLAGGRPYQGYLTFGVTASQSAGWSVNAIFGNRYSEGGPPLGISGFTQTASSAGERLGISADTPDQAFDRVVVCAVIGPNAGGIVVNMGDGDYVWQLDEVGYGARCRTFDSPRPVSSASITTLDERRVSITSFGTFRRRGGIVWSNVGVVGSQLQHFGRTSDAVVGEELRAYHPDLVVLAYGTNEGFSPSISIDGYEATLRAQIARLRRFLGRNTPIMLLGAPDAASRNGAIVATGCGGGWGVPGALGRVRMVQRQVARELGLAFWDWERAMGGTCQAPSWNAQGLMRGDMVHFTRDGGDRLGAQLYADLIRVPAAPNFVHPDLRRDPVTQPGVRRRP